VNIVKLTFRHCPYFTPRKKQIFGIHLARETENTPPEVAILGKKSHTAMRLDEFSDFSGLVATFTPFWCLTR